MAQRDGHKARSAKVELQAAQVLLHHPGQRPACAPALAVNVVVTQKVDVPEGIKPLCWRLLTTEPIDELAVIQRIVKDYEPHWRIEEYHKAWKSGVGASIRACKAHPTWS